MTLFLHIGMSKTGTSFLQRALNQAAPELLKYSIIYPKPLAGLGETVCPAHHFLAHAISGKRFRYTPKASFNRLSTHLAALKEELRASSDVGVISSEFLSGMRDEESIGRLRACFPEADVKILVYFRRQDAWIDSLYGQRLKAGEDTVPELEEFINISEWRMDYLSLLEPWEKHFGAENIVVRVYENLKGNALWSDFFAAIGKPEAAAADPGILNANDSLSFEMAKFLQSVNMYGQINEIRHMARGLNNHFAKTGGLKFLSQARAADLLSKYEASNAAVAKKYLNRDLLFTDTRPAVVPEREELSSTEISRVLGGITIQMLARMRSLEKRIDSLETPAKAAPANAEQRRARRERKLKKNRNAPTERL